MTPLFKGFLESELGKTAPSEALFHIIPAGFEKSVSYGTGTSRGPCAILKASQYLELYDGMGNPSKRGIFTLAPLECSGPVETVLNTIAEAVQHCLAQKKIPVLLGGEHTVSMGAFQALKSLDTPVGIVQFDAHADLRPTYKGCDFSHACVMNRAVSMGFPIFQIGVRSLSPEEVLFRKKKAIPHLDANRLFSEGIPNPLLPDDFPETIYITFDVDGLDPSVIPATGTPEPGGIFWYQAMDMLKTIISKKTIAGFDVVELAPIDGLHASDFASARLVYNIMGIIHRYL